MVKIPHFHGRGLGFNPWSGNKDPACCMTWPKKKKKRTSGYKQSECFAEFIVFMI